MLVMQEKYPAVFTVLLLCAVYGTQAAGDRKVLGYGWDVLAATPELILSNARKFDGSGLDGVFAGIRFSSGGKHFSSLTIANDPPWRRDELYRKLPVLREFVKHRGLKESLLGCWLMPQKRLAWDDDAAWRTFAENFGELAGLANSAGLKGLWLDTEDYAHQRQFAYKPGADGVSYDEAFALARKRGAELFGEVFREHPSSVVMATWLFSLQQGYFDTADPLVAMRSRKDLWPAFLNGMLDAAPLTAKLVDGDENGYLLDAAKNEFYREAEGQRAGVAGLIAPENRAKFRDLMSVGFGLYLDMYVNQPGGEYYFGPAADGSRVTKLRENLGQAVRVSSEYVWLYGEKHTWVEWTKVPPNLGVFQERWSDKLRGKCGTWSDALPGFTRMITYAKDRDGFLREEAKRFERDGKLVNKLANGKCMATEADALAGKLPGGFSDWTAPGSRENVFAADVSCGRGDTCSIAAGSPSSGCVMADAPVTPGDFLWASFYVRGEGASGSVAWKNGTEFQWRMPRALLVFRDADAEGWQRGEIFVQVPEGATTATLMASVELGPGQTVRLDDFELCVLPLWGED